MSLTATDRARMLCDSESPCGACSQCDDSDERGPEPQDNEDAGADEWPLTFAELDEGPCAGCRACEGT